MWIRSNNETYPSSVGWHGRKQIMYQHLLEFHTIQLLFRYVCAIKLEKKGFI